MITRRRNLGMLGLALVVALGLLVGAGTSEGGAAGRVSIKYNEAKWGKLPDKVVTNKDAKTVLVTATVHPAPHPEDMGLKYFHRRLEELTQSRMSTNYYPGGMLTKDARDLLDLNIKGDVDFTRHDTAAIASLSPPFELMGAAFLFDNPPHIYKFMDGRDFTERTRTDLEKNNLLLIGSWSFARHVYTRKPVKSLSDLKGMKIRTMEIRSVMDAWNALGANATPLPFGDLFTSLQTGLVDGGEGSATAYYSNKFHEVAKYMTVINYKYSTVSFVMNKKKFDSLPAELQKAVLQAGKEAVDLVREIYADWETDIFDTLRQSGVTVIMQKDMVDFPKWRDKVREAGVNAALFKKAGAEFERVIEQIR